MPLDVSSMSCMRTRFQLTMMPLSYCGRMSIAWVEQKQKVLTHVEEVTDRPRNPTQERGEVQPPIDSVEGYSICSARIFRPLQTPIRQL